VSLVFKQKHASKTARAEEEVQEHTPAEQDGKLTEDVDAILDEIDEVLEKDAESFVRGYVQKGGE
jgi:ubiquitin-like protein Pup